MKNNNTTITYNSIYIDSFGDFEVKLVETHREMMREEFKQELERRDQLLFDNVDRTCPHCQAKMHSHGKTGTNHFYAFSGYIEMRLLRMRCPVCGYIIVPGKNLIPETGTTAFLAECICDLASKMPYNKAADSLRIQHGIVFSNTKFWEHVQKEADQMEDIVEKQANSLYKTGEMPICVDLNNQKPLILGIDGGHVAGWKKHKSFEVKCATIATGTYVGNGKRRHLKDRVGYAANCSVDEFRKRVSLLALKSGYQSASMKIFVSDGAYWISKMIEDYFPDAIHVLDMYHLKNKVTTLFGVNAEGKDLQLREAAITACSNYSPRDLIRYISAYEPSDNRRLPIREDLITYVKNNAKAIDNHRYVHIHGSGWIEKGVDLMVSRRLKNRGMSWTKHGCSNMIPFTVLSYNNAWGEYWNMRKGFTSNFA